jgi:hypothetical protein
VRKYSIGGGLVLTLILPVAELLRDALKFHGYTNFYTLGAAFQKLFAQEKLLLEEGATICYQPGYRNNRASFSDRNVRLD